MKLRFILLLSFCCMILHAQNYYDRKNGKVKIDSANTVMTGKVKAHHATGTWKTYHVSSDGKKYVYAEINYFNGLKTGEYKKYFENGSESESGVYTLDKKNGKWINYNENGSVRSEAVYVNDTLDGEQLGYFENGKLSVKYVWKAGKAVSHEVWNDDGTPMSAEYFVNGKKSGKCWTNISRTNADTALYSYCYYLDGKKNGVERKVNADGSSRIVTWMNDTMNGVTKAFDAAGRETERGTWTMGKVNGKWINTYASGQVLWSWHTMSPITDSSHLFYPDGKIKTITVLIDRGRMKTHTMNYDTSGRKTDEGIKIQNMKDSVWTYYYPSGKVKARLDFVKGKPDGNYLTYYPDGKKFVTTHCAEGNVDAAVAVFDQKGGKIPIEDAKAKQLLAQWFLPYSEVNWSGLK